MSTNFHTVIPQQSSQYHHLSSLKSYIHFHNFFTISTHHPHSPLTDFSHAFIHHSHTIGHIETPFRPSKQTSTLRLSSWWWRGATLAKVGLVAINPYDFFTLVGSCIWWIVTGKGSTTLSCVGLGCPIGVITCGGMGNTCMLMDCSLMAVNPASFCAKALGLKHVQA